MQRFRGMFAFALWDRNRQTLFMARDRLGVKPLYYALLDDGTLLFGSELKSLLAHGGLKRDIDPLAVEEYFALGYVAEPRTIFRQARKLPPAHTLAIRRGQPVREPQAILGRPLHARQPHQRRRRLRRTACTACSESVRLRMISEVPLGAFLSGGVDSSAVVATMAGLSDDAGQHLLHRLRRPRSSTRAAFAQMVADRYHTDHHVETVKSDDFDLIDTLARLYDEPYADSSAIPTYRVCQLARKHVTVALSGDGGDETFGGYRRYRLHLMEERMRCALPAGVRQPLFGLLGPRLPQGRLGAARVPRQDHLRGHGAHLGGGLLPLACRSCAARCASQLFSAALQAPTRPATARSEVFDRHAARAGTDDPLALIQYLDLKTYLVGDINTKVDRASMAHSLEVREPLMDHKLVEWLATLPSQPEGARPGRQVPAQEGDGAATCRTTCCTARRWVLRCRWRAGSAGR